MSTKLIAADGLVQWPHAISEQKRNDILQLIYSNTADEELDQWLNYLESASSSDDGDEIMEILEP